MSSAAESGTRADTGRARRGVPALTAPRPLKLPTVADRTLANGLRVLAVRRPSVPLVELRLRVPFAGRGDAHLARATLLGETMFRGTAERDSVEIAAALQSLGAGLSAGTDADRLAVSGSVLANRLEPLLGLLAEVLTGATYPAHEVGGERDRLAQEITLARSEPQVVVHEALLERLYGDHPYGRDIPEPAAVQTVTPSVLRALHAKRVHPGGSTLVLVGDLRPEPTLDLAEQVLGGWVASTSAAATPRVRPFPAVPALLLDRPGAVQTNIRVAGAALARTDPGYPALQLANLVFGGYFSSRLVANIREDKGYTYSPHSQIEHASAGSRLVVDADVSTAVTAAALNEIRYELGRIATVPVAAEELDAARRYAVGSLSLATATSAGLAGALSQFLAAGLGVDYLRDHPADLAAVTVEQVQAAAAAHLAPAGLTTVLLGDAAMTLESLETLEPVELEGEPGPAEPGAE